MVGFTQWLISASSLSHSPQGTAVQKTCPFSIDEDDLFDFGSTVRLELCMYNVIHTIFNVSYSSVGTRDIH